jgi:hypothetical protein
MMDKPTLTPQGRDIDVLRGVTHRAHVAAGRGAKPEGKSAAKDHTFSWESAFHAERGCLDGGLPLRNNAPPRHH